MLSVHTRIKYCLMVLNVDPTHKGYAQLFDCIAFRVSHNVPVGEIYSHVALAYNVLPGSVMRNISYALNKIDNFSVLLSNLLGFRVNPDSIHNASVISYIADFVSDPDLFVPSPPIIAERG